MTVEEYLIQHNLNENDFDEYQMFWIRLGLKENLDISWYAHPKFNSNQMWEIRLGLIEELDVSIYAKSKFNWYQMSLIRLGLKNIKNSKW